jgi:predicted amidophosphoribosyltransferase
MGGRPGYMEKVPAAPFVAWVNGELERRARLDEGANGSGAMKALAMALRVNGRTVYRWKNSLDSERDQVVTEYPRRAIENALLLADITFEDLYPDVVALEDFELEQDAYCSSCHDVVTPINGLCPWCNREAQTEAPERGYCKREDAARFPALDGNCWRCGGKLLPYAPEKQCECECGQQIPAFNMRTGRPNRYVIGHYPHEWKPGRDMPVEPFAVWLEQQLRDLDPIQSLARRTRLSCDDVLDVLNRRVETIDRSQIRRALFAAAQEGQGQKIGPRPGIVKIGDLYNENSCPRCGGPKPNERAEFCRGCRTEVGLPNVTRCGSLTEPVLLEARSLYESGLTYEQVAERIQGRTRCKSVAGLRVALIVQFGKRGWSQGHRPRSEVAA